MFKFISSKSKFDNGTKKDGSSRISCQPMAKSIASLMLARSGEVEGGLRRSKLRLRGAALERQEGRLDGKVKREILKTLYTIYHCFGIYEMDRLD
ncbi:hypothetical protein L484_025620 [Morus notabilis]|uniref:Uncharacterized protein n=1 Tax=Morus notabilis TaxID=981085 RepID=W9RJD2_9ROSA|nr:hypothetical protein L484_025620 [Morus notabilis]